MSKDRGDGDGQKRHVGQTTTGTAAVTMSGPKRCQLKIKLLEDLHTGAGMAIGELDATQIRDRRGRPVIRATHVRGLWRAAADELVALKIVSADECSALFGATGAEQRGRFVLSSLRLGGSISARSVAWTSTARKVFDRSPLEDTLRTIEFVAAGTEFTAELEVDAKLKPALERCVRHTIALGAWRSRGAGSLPLNCLMLRRWSRLAFLNPQLRPFVFDWCLRTSIRSACRSPGARQRYSDRVLHSRPSIVGSHSAMGHPPRKVARPGDRCGRNADRAGLSAPDSLDSATRRN